MRFLAALQFLNKCVIPEKPYFSAQQENTVLSGIRFGFFRVTKQIGFRINFLSPCGEEKVLRNDAFVFAGYKI
jgi:hypothetical protein